MLEIRRLKRYRIAKYPRLKYTPRTPGLAEELLKRGSLSLLLMSLIEALGCETGVSGPPPVLPNMVTENEARQVINQVFSNDGIELDEDYNLVFHLGPADSVVLSVDGYNDSLRVGYEYLVEADRRSFTPAVRSALADSAEAAGPFLKTLDQSTYYSGWNEHLEYNIEAFIDTLKAHGVI